MNHKQRSFLQVIAAMLIGLAGIFSSGCKGTPETRSQCSPRSLENNQDDAYVTGKLDAQRDAEARKFAIETFGLPAPWRAEFARLLRERHGIELRAVAGCVVDDQILGHSRGYNEVMTAEIQKRFGKDVFDVAAADARKAYEKKTSATH